MKSEKKYQLKVSLSLLVVALCATAYAWGGIEMKWLRRFLAPCLAAGFLAVINKDPWQLVKAPLLGMASSLGYGADMLWTKIFKRAYVGLAFSLGASFTSIRDKKWLVVIYTSFVVTSAYILLGVWNPLHARVEETLLGVIVYTWAIVPSIKE
jgi:hypothetical protein